MPARDQLRIAFKALGLDHRAWVIMLRGQGLYARPMTRHCAHLGHLMAPQPGQASVTRICGSTLYCVLDGMVRSIHPDRSTVTLVFRSQCTCLADQRRSGTTLAESLPGSPRASLIVNKKSIAGRAHLGKRS